MPSLLLHNDFLMGNKKLYVFLNGRNDSQFGNSCFIFRDKLLIMLICPFDITA
ncbi:hypothetical protein SRABI96_04276 [Peribacillus sp. Bi96]|nr:hypothetical protein SRABI96_04276 [Peribacillus sp. Bi96]